MPPSNTAPLRDPARSRTAEWPSRCQGDASSARALGANDEARRVAATPTAARLGTMAIMRRLYRQARRQTIELLVRAARWIGSLIDRTATQYQDGPQSESGFCGWTLKAKRRATSAADLQAAANLQTATTRPIAAISTASC